MKFAVGQKVRLKKKPAESGEVLEIHHIPGDPDPLYKVRFASGSRTVEEASLIELAIPREPEDQLRSGLLGGMPELRLLLTYLRLKERNLTDQLRSLRAARLKHLPYQYKPLLKFLDSPEQRILIADEVGLGKTIEAGIILQELMARQALSRVLIIVPSNLVLKWQAELRERFDLEFEQRDNAWLREHLLKPVSDADEPSPFRAICALEAIRLLADAFDEVRPLIDLVIVDEAHRLRNESSLSHKLGRTLGETAEGMLLCSATPMQTASNNLYNLLRVMLGEGAGTFNDFQADLQSNRPIVEATTALSRSEPLEHVAQVLEQAKTDFARSRPSDVPLLQACIDQARHLDDADRPGRVNLLAQMSQLNWFGSVMTRTRKRMVLRNVAPRVARAVPIDFAPEELAFYNSFCERTRTATSNGKWGPAAFASVMRQRQVASCLAAFRSEMERGLVDPEARAAMAMELEVDDDVESAPPEAPLSAPRLPTDTKLNGLLKLLKQLRDQDETFKLIVFATFRPTIHYLEAKLVEAGWSVEVLTGEILDRRERSRRVQRVRTDPSCHVLLATEVGCEGIDLQFASTLVNYDLPWNPMVVEQRIGRLDRIGQNAPEIRIFNLAVNQTIEERILVRLYQRLHLFEQSIGAMEVIIGERIQQLALDLARLTPEEQERRLEEEQLALENIQHESKRLDAEAMNLLGDDAYYNQRLEEIEARQGDIGADLQAFVSDFLGREFQRASLIPADAKRQPGLLKLTYDSELLAFLSGQRLDQLGPGAGFLGRYAQAQSTGGLLVTFEQAVADANRDVEFLTSTHRFVRAIASRIEAQERSLVQAFSIRVTSAAIPPGRYLAALALHRVSGIRPRNEFVLAAVDCATQNPVSTFGAETLLNDLLRSGESFRLPAGVVEELENSRKAAELAVVQRCKAVKAEVAGQNELYVVRRVDSLRRWYGTRTGKLRERAAKHTDVRVRRMALGQASKLDAKLAAEIARAEEARVVEAELSTEAYFVVEVAAPKEATS